MKVGDVVTFQLPEILSASGDTIRLSRIERDDVDPGVAVLGIRIAPAHLDRPVVAPGWPPHLSLTDTPVFPVEGFELSSRGTGDLNHAVLIVGVRLTQPGRHGSAASACTTATVCCGASPRSATCSRCPAAEPQACFARQYSAESASSSSSSEM